MICGFILPLLFVDITDDWINIKGCNLSSGLTVLVFCCSLYDLALNINKPILSLYHFTWSFHVQFYKFPPCGNEPWTVFFLFQGHCKLISRLCVNIAMSELFRLLHIHTHTQEQNKYYFYCSHVVWHRWHCVVIKCPRAAMLICLVHSCVILGFSCEALHAVTTWNDLELKWFALHSVRV